VEKFVFDNVTYFLENSLICKNKTLVKLFANVYYISVVSVNMNGGANPAEEEPL